MCASLRRVTNSSAAKPKAIAALGLTIASISAGEIELLADVGEVRPDVGAGDLSRRAMARRAAGREPRLPACRIAGPAGDVGDGHARLAARSREEAGGGGADAAIGIAEDDRADRLAQLIGDLVLGGELNEQLPAVRILRHRERRIDAPIDRRRVVEHERPASQHLVERRRRRRPADRRSSRRPDSRASRSSSDRSSTRRPAPPRREAGCASARPWPARRADR